MLDDLSVFVAVARAGSFTAGADALGISTSYASKRVRRLEDALGRRLLNRSTRALTLTPEGQAYLERCGPALDEIEDAGRALVDPDDAPRGLLRVTVPLSLGLRRVAPLVGTYLQRYPQASIDIDFSDRTVDVVSEGFDLAIRAGPLQDSDLIARRIGGFPLYLVASPDYLARRGVPRTLQDLIGHDCMIYTLARGRRAWTFDGPDGPVVVPLKGRMTANNGDALAQAAAAGLGIGLEPSFIVADMLASGQLVRVLPDLPGPMAPVWAIYPESRLLSPKVQRFVELVQEDLAASCGNAPR